MALSRESMVTLVPCAIMLCLTSWVMMLDSGFNRMSSDGSIDWDEGGHGEEIRRLVQVILSLAALFRAIEIGLDLLILTPFKEAIEYPPYHAVADMLYISVYALLTLFWAQLCLVTMGNRKRILRHIFAIGLSSFCLLFGATVFVVAFSHLSTTLHKTLTCIIFAELGAANAIVGIILLYFGVRVINFTQKYGSIAVRKPWALICRTICLTVLCSGACLLKFAVSITIATGTIQLQNDLNNPRKWTRLYSVSIWVTDMIPTWVLFVLTLRQQRWKPLRFSTRELRHTYRFYWEQVSRQALGGKMRLSLHLEE